MSAEQFGARLLGEVKEESLEGLLAQLRITFNPTPSGLLGVSQFDQWLEVFRYHQLATTSTGPGWTSPEAGTSSPREEEYIENEETQAAASKAQRPARIEITGHGSASTRTALLYHFTAIAILPKDHKGKQSAVVWIDSDNHFSPLQLRQTIQSLLSKSNPDLSPNTKTDITDICLKHVHILQPQSSSQLISQLQTLPTFLLNTTHHLSAHRSLILLVIDSMTAFHWQDRFDTEMARLEAGSNLETNTTTSQPASKTLEIQNLIDQIQRRFECTLLYTTDSSTHPAHKRTRPRPASSTSTSHPQPPIFQEPTPLPPWTAFATLSLTIQRVAVPQFAPNMSIEACQRDREKRQEAVRKGRIVVSVDWRYSDSWPGGVKEVIEGIGGKRGVVLRVTGDGVEFE